MGQRFGMSEADHARVSAAVARAEKGCDAEIVTIVARQSDAYHDAGLHWAILAAFLVCGLAAAFPERYESGWIAVMGGWTHRLPPGQLLLLLLGNMIAVFLAMRYLLAIPALRMAMTPGSTKTRRVRRRAILLFRAAAERRTRGLAGVLLYVSLNEHRAELIADEAINQKVDPARWGEAMAALVDSIRAGEIAGGMAQAVERIGDVLTQICPRRDDNPNELPDRLIEL